MKEASFQVCAAVSLAVHLGLAVGSAVAMRHAAAPAPHGSGGTSEGGAAALGGETFDIAEETPPLEESPPASAASEATAAAAAASDPRETIELDEHAADATRARATPATPARAHASRNARATAAREASSAAPPPQAPQALYGAVGERGSIDLVFAFKRAFPQGAGSDPIWNQVPVGFYAEGDVTFLLDPAGTLTHTTVSAGAAPAFRAAVARTVAVIKGRPFTARGAATRLHMVVRVSDKLTNQGRFMIDAAGSFELPSGRHVGVTITER